MATSSSSDFTRTRDQLIMRAARIIGAVRAGATMKAQDTTDFAEALNAMVKRWQASGIHVWTTAEATLFPQVDQVRYSLASGSTDHATETYYETEVSAAEASGQTVLSVDSTTNMTVADNIGVLLDDGSLFWSTISSKTSTTVTIADAIDDSAAAGNPVYTYTTKIVRPLKIVDARRFDILSDADTPIRMLARLDYQGLSQKTQTGTITQAFYDPQLSTGYFYLWNPPAEVTSLVKFTWHRPIQDFDAAGDNPDLPQEWIDPLVFNLATIMAPEYDVPMDKFQQVSAMALKFLDDVAGFDREAESIEFGVDMG